MANYTKWSLPLREEIRKIIIEELHKIVEENPLPVNPHFESIEEPYKHYCPSMVINEDKFYIGMSEDKNVSR